MKVILYIHYYEMKFCEVCKRLMVLDAGGRLPIFVCNACNSRVEGNNEDTMLLDNELTTGDSTAQSALLIENAPFDPASMRKKRDCPECKRDYMAVLILDQGSRVVYRCKCGYMIEQRH